MTATNLPRTSALLLDADGVIQYPTKGWLLDMERLGGPGFIKEIFTLEETTLTGEVDLRELIDEVLNRRGRAAGPDDILEIWYRIEPDQRVLALIEKVRAAGVTTVLATNQQSYRGSWMQSNLPYGDYFDLQVYSYEIGLAKPDPAYFDHIIDALGIEPGEAVFVDDKLANVEGARSVGIRAEHFAWTDTIGQLRAALRHQQVPGL